MLKCWPLSDRRGSGSEDREDATGEEEERKEQGTWAERCVCVCVFIRGRKKGWGVALAGPALHSEVIAFLAHLLPLLSLQQSASKLTDFMHKTLKLRRRHDSQQTTLSGFLRP